LAQIDDSTYIKSLEKAQADLAAAQIALHDADASQAKGSADLRTQAITADKFAEIRNNFTKATANLRTTRDKLDQAKTNLENTKIKAPQDGNIAKKSVDVGTFVAEGQLVFGFVGSSTRWVIGNFSESQLGRINIGTLAQVKVEGVLGKTYTAEVESKVKRSTAAFDSDTPESQGPNLSKNSTRTVVRLKILNLNEEDKNQLQDGLPASISISVR
jgi:membrane fusion protein (multidrug efflux system)